MAKQLTNEELIAIYKRDMELDTDMLSENTIKGHVRYITLFLNAMNKQAFDITKSEINHYVLNLKKQNGEDMNIDAKQNHMSSIKRFYNFLFVGSDDRNIMMMRYFYDDRDNKIEIPNPADGLKSVNSSAAAKLKKNPRKEGLTLSEAQRLIDAVKNHVDYTDVFSTETRRFISHRDYVMILMMLEIGLRFSDISSLTVADTLLNGNRLDIVIKKTKKRKSYELSDYLVTELKTYLKLHNNRSELLFCSFSGNKCDNKETNNILKKYQKKAGIKKEVTCHILRHTCGALMYEETKDLAFVKELLGHGSVTTTQRYVYSEDVVKEMGQTTSKVTGKLVATA